MGTLPRGPCIPWVVHNLGTAMEVHRHDEMYGSYPVDDGLRLGLDVHCVGQSRQEWIVAVELHVVVIMVGGMDAVFQYQVIVQMIGAVGVLKRTDV